MSLLDTAFSMTNMFQRIQFKLIKSFFYRLVMPFAPPPQKIKKKTLTRTRLSGHKLCMIFSLRLIQLLLKFYNAQKMYEYDIFKEKKMR